MIFNDSCVACAGTGATLDSNGVCQCADFATLIDNAADGTAICKCKTNFLPFKDVCVMCYGIGAIVENDACTCNDIDGAQFDPLLVGKCICKPQLFTVSLNAYFIRSNID